MNRGTAFFHFFQLFNFFPVLCRPNAKPGYGYTKKVGQATMTVPKKDDPPEVPVPMNVGMSREEGEDVGDTMLEPPEYPVLVLARVGLTPGPQLHPRHTVHLLAPVLLILR
jgi:hypothetical protein